MHLYLVGVTCHCTCICVQKHFSGRLDSLWNVWYGCCCTRSEPGILLHFHASFAMFLHASTGVFTKTRYIPGVSRHDLTSALRLASVWSQRTCRTWRVRARHALINCTCAWAPTNELRSDCGGNTLIAGCNPRNAKPRNLNLNCKVLTRFSHEIFSRSHVSGFHLLDLSMRETSF